jgi:predicted nucleic acid-binding protein
MGPIAALFDSNILIDWLNGHPAAAAEISLYEDAAISLVTWMEVMAGAPVGKDDQTRAFLQRLQTLRVDEAVAEEAVRLRRDFKIKLPDAIIWATARVQARILVTRNTKDFPAEDPGVRVPYQIG